MSWYSQGFSYGDVYPWLHYSQTTGNLRSWVQKYPHGRVAKLFGPWGLSWPNG